MAIEKGLERVRQDAAKCRDLASSALTPAGREVLSSLAEKYEQEAVELELSGLRRVHRTAFDWPVA